MKFGNNSARKGARRCSVYQSPWEKYHITPSSTISLFADDIALYRCIRSPADYIVLQSDITAITMTLELEGRLKLHANKCCCMFISRKQIHSATPPPLYIRADSHLQQVDSVKYLGVILTSDLTWTKHITRICSKTCKLTGMLYRRFHLCDPQVMLRLYKAFIRPHFKYMLHRCGIRTSLET